MKNPKASRAVSKRRGWLRRLISIRRGVQVTVGIGLYFGISYLGISLLWIVLVGSALGVVFGKFFCRWMCPMGAIMETMLGAGGDEEGRQKSLYMYFKLGCPIAWAGGLLNKVSLLRVKVEPARCTHCGLCDKACYVAGLAQGHSLHASGLLNASTHYSCSRCLGCVSACPTGALNLGALGQRTLPSRPVAPQVKASASP